MDSSSITTSAKLLLSVGKVVGALLKALAPQTVQRQLANNLFFNAIDEAGLTCSYKDRESARQVIVAAVRTAKFVKILSNKGNEWLGPRGMIMEPLLARAHHTRVAVQVLLHHPRSPWLMRRAAEKGFWDRSAEDAARQFSEAHDEVLIVKSLLPNLRPLHFHRHDPSWRFMLTDREIFLQTYNTGEQIERERVLQFSAESPIYASALRYFDFLYDLDSAERDQISPLAKLDQKTIMHEASAALLVTRQSIGRRQVLLLQDQGSYGISKGGIKAGEEPLEAGQRELNEEAGADFRGSDGRFVGSVLVGQPFDQMTSVKVILLYHMHCQHEVCALDLKVGAIWIDVDGLEGAVPTYDYVPEVLAKIGIRPRRWSAPKFHVMPRCI